MRKLLLKSINLNDSHHTTRRIDQSTNSKIKASLYHKSSRESLAQSYLSFNFNGHPAPCTISSQKSYAASVKRN